MDKKKRYLKNQQQIYLMTKDPMILNTVGATGTGNSKMQAQDFVDVEDRAPMNMGTVGIMGEENFDTKTLDFGNLDSDLKMVERVMNSLP